MHPGCWLCSEAEDQSQEERVWVGGVWAVRLRIGAMRLRIGAMWSVNKDDLARKQVGLFISHKEVIVKDWPFLRIPVDKWPSMRMIRLSR